MKINKKRIVLAPYGSLGDLHPFLALGIELRERGLDVVINTIEPYREKIDALDFEFFPLRPNVDPEDREFAKVLMDARNGTERLIKDLLLPNLHPMYEDLMTATEGADVLIPGEIVFPSASVAEKRGIKRITTTLAPLSMFSSYESSVFPNAQWLQHMNFLGRHFRSMLYSVMKNTVNTWLRPYRKFRQDIGLDPHHDPLVEDKFSEIMHLAMFSKFLGKPQPDWHSPTLQTGFCFYDGQKDLGVMPEKLTEFLADGEPPIVFTLGSAAVMDARDFFEQSIEAAKILERRAVFLYGIFNQPPEGFDEMRVGFDYAPYSQIFPKAACVVHQGGVGTTAQVLRAGIPALIMPFSHDQPDNAARCRRKGVAEIISRDNYEAENVAYILKELTEDESYKTNALEAKNVIARETGTRTACDAIEAILAY